MTRVALVVAVIGVAAVLVAVAMFAGGEEAMETGPTRVSATVQASSTTQPPPTTTQEAVEPLDPTFEPDVAVADAAVESITDIRAVLAAANVTGEPTEHPKMLVDGGPLWSIPVTPGYAAADVWQQLRDVYPQTGWWPVLVTELTFSRIGYNGIPVPTDWESAQPDGNLWLESRYAKVVAQYDEPPERGPMPEFEWADESYDWADAWDAAGERYDRILLVPARAPWLVPAVLRWSGPINYDENGADLANVLYRWYGRWSAEIVAMDDAELALRVGNPPDSTASALRAAFEAFLTCTDSVDQGAGTVDALAPSMTLPLWQFWWD